MLKVICKETKQEVQVYDIQYSHGYPNFLIYKDNRWIIRSAKYYKPYEKSISDIVKEVESEEC